MSAWVEVNFDVLRSNIAALQAVVRPSTALIFVIKANAYGHGLVETARAAAQAGIRWFGVAHTHEALAVRAALPDVEILVMGAMPPEDAPILAQHRITPMIVSAAHGDALSASAMAQGLTLRGHVKVDTGMGRLGVLASEAVETFKALRGCAGLDVTGLCSHFSTVEPKSPQRAEAQVAQFVEAAKACEALAGKSLMKHISSSRAILYHPEWDFDAVRPGICLYGYGAAERNQRFRTRPFLQWKCRVMQIKEVPAGFPVGYYGTYTTQAPTRMGVLSAGYADGYHRALSNRGHVIIDGRRCPVLGRVSMNWITVDIGPDSKAQMGDEAVLIGEQRDVSVWAGELARICRTIPYEMLVGINQTAERRNLMAHPPVSGQDNQADANKHGRDGNG